MQFCNQDYFAQILSKLKFLILIRKKSQIKEMRNVVNNGNGLKEKLKAKLREIFQFENEDLGFGIYRIMNYKRKEIEEFIEKELISGIRKQLELVGEEEISKIKEEFERYNMLFQEDETYIQKILEKADVVKKMTKIYSVEFGTLRSDNRDLPFGSLNRKLSETELRGGG